MNNFVNWNNGNYIIISGFAEEFCTQDNHEDFVKDLVLEKATEHTMTVRTYTHPVLEFIESKKQMLIELVNATFNLNVNEMFIGGTCIQQGQGIPPHNDDWDKDVVARAIITFNPSKVFGTDVFTGPDDKEPVEIGGGPGDLFVFKVSEDSWHGVGLKDYEHEDRFSYNINFYSSS